SADRPDVGRENYELLLNSHEIWNALRVTEILTVISVPIRLALALASASFLFGETAAARILRVAFFLPAVTSTVSIAVVFSWVFSTDYGMANGLLQTLGLPKVQWLQTPSLALGALILVNTWKQLGYDIIIYIAA